MNQKQIKRETIGIINQLFDLAEVSVEKRQDINDTADDYLYSQIIRIVSECSKGSVDSIKVKPMVESFEMKNSKEPSNTPRPSAPKAPTAKIPLPPSI